MNHTHKFAAVLAAGALTLLPISSPAQTPTPVAEPPPPIETPAPSATPDKPAEAPISLTESTNSTGKSSGNNTVKELRFSAVDLDANGLISLTEFTTFMNPGPTSRSASSADATPSSVNPAEVLFRQIDKDGDNFLSETEVTAYQDEQNRNAPAR